MSHSSCINWDILKFYVYVSNSAKTQPWQNTVMISKVIMPSKENFSLSSI